MAPYFTAGSASEAGDEQDDGQHEMQLLVQEFVLMLVLLQKVVALLPYDQTGMPS